MPQDAATTARAGLDAAALDFLLELVDEPGPSGFEGPVSAIWRRYAADFADVREDAMGNAFATVNAGGGPRVALVGHIDEIGLIVTRIDDEGYLRCTGIGGWDAAVLVGQRVRVLGRDGVVHGSVSRPAVHVLEASQREKLPKLADLWVDIGATSGDEARALVDIGTPMVIDAAPVRVGEHRVRSRALDNRLGAFVTLEVLRALARADELGVEVTAVGSVSEEIGGPGAVTATYGLQPDVALAIDVTTPGDTPGGTDIGDLKLGGGPIVTRGATTNRAAVDRLIETAASADIPVQLRGMGIRTKTDADHMVHAGAGVPVALVSVPCRYLHSPCELADLRDVRACIELIAAWAQSYAR